MKNRKIKLNACLLLVIVVLIAFNSCKKFEPALKYMDINGHEYEINAAYVNIGDVDALLQYRTFTITFESESYPPSPTYLAFDLYSYSTSKDLEEGTYLYSKGKERGKISKVELGKDIVYYDDGDIDKGIRIMDSTLLVESENTVRDDIEVDGKINVGWKNNDFFFEIDSLKITFGEEVYIIYGEINLKLQDVNIEEENVIEDY